MLKFPNVDSTNTNIVINDDSNPQQIGLVREGHTNYIRCMVTGKRFPLKTMAPLLEKRTVRDSEGKFYVVTVVLTPTEEAYSIDGKVVAAAKAHAHVAKYGGRMFTAEEEEKANNWYGGVEDLGLWLQNHILTKTTISEAALKDSMGLALKTWKRVAAVAQPDADSMVSEFIREYNALSPFLSGNKIDHK